MTTDPGDLEPAVDSLNRGIQLLRAFTADRPSLGLSELGRLTGINKRVVLRIATTLESLGYLVQDPETRSYTPSHQALRLGYTYLEGLPFRRIARPFLLDLAHRTGEFVSLAILDGVRTICVDRVPAAGTKVGVTILVGHRGWAHLSSHGKILLTGLSDDELRAMYAGVEWPLPTPYTITTFERLLDEVRVARERQFAINDQESSIGVRSAAAAIRDAAGTILCSVNIAVPSSRADRSEIESTFAPEAQRAARLATDAIRSSQSNAL